ncbi:hypothetical protein [Ruegeria sp. HKCCD6109]|uniref:hypothetical protein n=1 Tax=Ruegeria sp. HKCCD6109 TaxID=2683017 RepID=UPI001490C306|nr:hypothetical protein [Ruegeria sp. HKCCD6109]NOD62724.1 hypothetical protein [Ruegeria sp. HKCCD6109]
MNYPIAVTAHLPIKGTGHSALPAIFAQGEAGDVKLLKIGVAWASDLSEVLGTVSVHKHVSTLCRFLNFLHAYAGGEALSVKAQTKAVLAYVDFRIEGTTHLPRDNSLYYLKWSGISKTTARNEFNHLIRFLTWLEERNDGESKAIDRSLFSLGKIDTQQLKSYEQKDFFLHLKSQRRFWKHLEDGDDVRPPRKLISAKRKTGFKSFPSEQEVRSIIASETNPAFKAIWLLQAYGASHRISEVLQIWQEDILPASETRNFFNFGGDGLPLVLIAHPAESTWLGGHTHKKLNRLNFMLQTYGIRPRSELPDSSPKRAGFKSKELYGRHMTAKTWWLNAEAAHAFQDCVDQIERFHRTHRTSTRHPYFFVNMFARGDSLGQPISYKRIAAAWTAACKRSGVQISGTGKGIHSLRHFQKWLMKEMGIPSSDIQLIRGDASPDSQDAYGRCAATVSRALTQNLH